MAKFNACIGIGFANATQRIEFEVDDEDLEGLSSDDREEYLYREAEEVINSYGIVEIYYEEID